MRAFGDGSFAHAPGSTGALVLHIALAAIVGLTLVDALAFGPRRHARFAQLTDTGERQRALWRRFVSSLLKYGLVSTTGLAAMGRLDVLWHGPAGLAELSASPALAPLAALLTALQPAFEWGILGFIATVLVASLPLAVLLARRRRLNRLYAGKIGALLPRNGAEVRLCAALSLNAGVCEELYFRAFAPAVFFSLWPNAIAVNAAALVLFGLGHLYQGWTGVAATFAVGLLLFLFYAATGNLGAPIAAHALLNLRSLVVIPLLVARMRREPLSQALGGQAGLVA